MDEEGKEEKREEEEDKETKLRWWLYQLLFAGWLWLKEASKELVQFSLACYIPSVRLNRNYSNESI